MRAAAHVMEINPILLHESRARWRGWRGFALVLGYAALLSGMMAFFYNQAAGNDWGAPDNGQSSSQLGAELFGHLCWMQALGWMLIAPALTASSIAGERENGLLESLHLSPISPMRIVWGKLWSALLLILLMLAIALPPVALCFVLGGVSPTEFYAATALHVATAFFCATIGLFCSAWSHRAGISMRTAFVSVILWGISSTVAMALSSTTMTFLNWSGWPGLLHFYGLTNPIIAALFIPSDGFSNVFATPGAGWSLGIIPTWSLSPLLQVGFGMVLLLLAARALRRPLSEAPWMGEGTASAVETGLDTDQSTTANRRTTSSTQHAKAACQPWSLPLATWLRASNPVLQRELRGKFKFRRPSSRAIGCMTPLLIGLVYGYGRLLWEAWTAPYGRDAIWWLWAFVGLSLIVLMSSVSGAAAFTGEREAGTWESLGLTLLSPWEIIWGKVLPPVFTTVIYSTLLWPILWPTLGPRSNSGGDYITSAQAIATGLILLTTAWNLTIFGMLISWHCRRTAIATGWIIGILFFTYLLGPVMFEVAFSPKSPAEARLFDLITVCHPFIALNEVAGSSNPLGETVFRAFLLFATGNAWLLLLRWAMRRGVRERDADRTVMESA